VTHDAVVHFIVLGGEPKRGVVLWRLKQLARGQAITRHEQVHFVFLVEFLSFKLVLPTRPFNAWTGMDNLECHTAATRPWKVWVATD
jgi:hypothetical protein